MLGAGGSPRLQKSPPNPVVETRDQPPRDGPALWGGGGVPRRWGPNRGFRQRPNPRDSIKKLARAAGGEAKPGDLYYEDRLFKTARLAARPRSRRPRDQLPGAPRPEPRRRGVRGAEPTGGVDKSRGGDLAGRGETCVSQPFQGGGIKPSLREKTSSPAIFLLC